MILYDEERIRVRLGSLPASHRPAFALGQAERWAVAYKAFTAATGEGDATILLDALDAAWDAVGTGEGHVPLDGVEAQLAIAERHKGQAAEAAQGAAFCACYALDAVNEPEKVEHAMYAARWVYNATDAWLGYELGANVAGEATTPAARKAALATLDATIKAHPRMQRELGIVTSALDDLADVPAGDGSALVALREKWRTSWPPLD